MTNTNNYFASNLRNLRKRRKLNQTQLGRILNCANTTISRYECSKLNPTDNEDLIKDISKFFKVSNYDLLYTDLSKEALEMLNKTVNSFDFEKFSNTIICFTSKDARNNDLFVKATALLNKIQNSNNPSIKLIHDCKDLFLESYRTSNLLSSAANVIYLIFLEYFILCAPNELSLELSRNKLTIYEIKEYTLNQDYSFKKSFLDENEEILKECLLVLKNNSSTSDVAYYYIALRYLCNLFNTDSVESNASFGLEMMLMLYDLENKYAIEYIENLDSLMTIE